MASPAIRDAILQAAFQEFYRNGFQAASLQQISDRAGATKGALFYYFRSKSELAIAVIQEVLEPMGNQRWIAPVAAAPDPIAALQQAFRRNLLDDAANGDVLAQGCPLNNLAQEMSSLDESLRLCIEQSYQRWRDALAAVLLRAQRRRQIRKSAVPAGLAALIVACQMGIWGTAKNSHDRALALQAVNALCAALQNLRAPRRKP